MTWRMYTGVYLLCASVFWSNQWIETTNYLMASICFLVGIIICRSEFKKEKSHQLSYIFFCVGLPVLTYIFLCFFNYIFSNVHNVSIFGKPLAVLFHAVGYQAESHGGYLFLSDEGTSYQITIDAEKLGLIHGGALFLAFFTTSIFLRSAARKLLLFSIATFFYICLRFVLLIMSYLFINSFSWLLEHLSIFWSVPFLILTFIPITIFARTILKWSPPDFSAMKQPRTFRIALLFCISFFFLQIALWLHLPGERKSGRILIDDYYSNVWEPSAKPFTTNEYGRESVYNMWLGRKYLEHFYSVKVNERPLQEKDLRETDVLVIKTPIYRLGDEAVEMIESYVRKGGGLLLVGDHTDLMGMTSHLNEISKRFGIQFRFDATYDLTTGHDNHSATLELFRPSISKQIADVRMMTTSTMEITPFLVQPISWVRSSISDEADYSRPSFFGPMEVDLSDEYGCFVIGASRNVGDGKVAAICESTVFSNFAIFMSSRDEWLRRLVEYVNYKSNPFENYIRIGALIFFFICFFYGCLLIKRNLTARHFASISTGVLMGLWFGIVCTDWVSINVEYFNPNVPLPSMYFLKYGTQYNLPDPMAHYHGVDDDAYEAVYVNVARTGWMPHEIDRFTESISKSSPLVLIRPQHDVFSDTLLHWINDGGKVLIFVSNDVTMKQITNKVFSITDSSAQTDTITIRRLKYGKGNVVLLSPAEAFSRARMGDVMEDPSTEVKAVLEKLYEGVRLLNESQ